MKDSREIFERGIRSRYPAACLDRGVGGEYIVNGIEREWIGWDARDRLGASVLIVDACASDADELRKIAMYFDQRGKNAEFLRTVANRYEVLVGAYTTASNVRNAASDFFAWANKTWPNPGGNDDHPWNRLAVALGVDA